MKLFKYMLVGAVAAWGFAPSAYAFHSGGVADCEGCHTMHNSFEGSAMKRADGTVIPVAQYTTGPYLLKGNDQSSACLNCHQDPAAGGYHISTPGVAGAVAGTPTVDTSPIQMTPGGDFAWLKMTRAGKVRGTATTWNGERQGHNIVAADFGYLKDSVQITAPGGTYPAASLACSSCHDPHGKYRRDSTGVVTTTGLPIFNSGSYTTSNPPNAGVSAVGVYRLLAGKLYQPKSLAGSFAFGAASPDALAPGGYNGANATIAGTNDLVAYGQGMSEWCANCHTAMHLDTYTSGTKGLVHPAGNGAKLTAAVIANYTAYVSSGIAGTPVLGGYSSLAPFEVGTGDYAALKAFQAAPTAPPATANVACVSCHRAHASAFESSTRFYLGNEFMTVGDGLTAVGTYDTNTTENKINTSYSTLSQTNGYNGRPPTLFNAYQRNYCNKCHAKD